MSLKRIYVGEPKYTAGVLGKFLVGLIQLMRLTINVTADVRLL